MIPEGFGGPGGSGVFRGILILAAAFLFIGCGVPEVLIVSDEYWDQTGPVPGDATRLLTAALGESGHRSSIITVPSSAGIDAFTDGRSFGAPVVLLSPYHSALADRIADSMPDIRFVAAGRKGAVSRPNLATIYSDRTEVMNRAGRLSALVAEELGRIESRAPVAAVLFYSGTSARHAEEQAFLDGFESAGTEAGLEYHVLRRLGNEREAIDYLNGIQALKPVLFAVFCSTMNGAVLDHLSTVGGRLVMENRGVSGEAYGPMVLFSVEEDIVRAYVDAVETEGGRSIAIPAYIRSGPAMRDIPEETVAKFSRVGYFL